MQNLSHLLHNIPSSPTLAVNDKAKALQRAGHDVIALAGGDPDFPTPPHIVEAAYRAMLDGATHYPAPMIGIPAALEAIAAKMERENGVMVADPRHQIIVTPGGKWGLFLALTAVLNPGDEVLILEPHWVSYPPMVTLAGGVPVPVSLPADDNFRITAAALRARLTPRTKALMVNNPCNPTGRVLTPEELAAIVAVATEADLYVIADEIYEKLVFDGRSHLSIAAAPGMAERTLTVNGLTKSYAMTGWRLGWLVGPAPIIKLATRLNSQAVSCAATFSMHACVAALNGPQDIIAEMRDAYQTRRDFMVQALNEIEGVACRSIEGAFYLFPSFPGSGKNSLELADALLDKAQIAGVPGIAFGQSGEGHVRFAISTAMHDLERAVERLAKVAREL
ncbi:MAG: pyridoxal phosphate-dependent aminotransferase [Chloroflexi bacterium]|nr:pyridoxal phosphate-dependent aminotransferase [Chloroflexota bacterium]MBP7042263.1 pyridoxal phosphate-dependent aminotransferase [Chloroflexota bacterium]